MFLEHKGYVSKNMLTKATGAHFNEKGHKISDMQITVIEKIFNPLNGDVSDSQLNAGGCQNDHP